MRIETSRVAAPTRRVRRAFGACTCLWNACACGFVASFASAHRKVDSAALTERIVQTREFVSCRMSMHRYALIAKPMRRAYVDALLTSAFDAERFVHDAMHASTRRRMRCIRSPHSRTKLNRSFMHSATSTLRPHRIDASADTRTDARRTRTHEHIRRNRNKNARHARRSGIDAPPEAARCRRGSAARDARSRNLGVAAGDAESGLLGEAAGGIGLAVVPDRRLKKISRIGAGRIRRARSLRLRWCRHRFGAYCAARPRPFRNVFRCFVTLSSPDQLAIANLRKGMTADLAASALALAAALR
ncbi:hypothetical protein [Lysobacter enzymogenes]|uniref:hypothetical protein n=1 Tax=Lysobacter enzymogenes TaxID=69 RepID=UPI00089A6178|nr:hypothetical protein [Lysobacter enzymogenes]SDY15961.1 hypothetical protein SAMN05421681_11260 [Lysobacter enzymogenes]